MAEVIGLGASIISVLQITYSVIAVCYEYKVGVQNASRDIDRITDELVGLRSVLEQLEVLATRRVSHLEALSIIQKPDGPLRKCEADLKKLMDDLKPPTGWRKKGQTLMWPMKERDVRKTLAHLESSKSLLHLALAADQTSLSLAIHDTVATAQKNILTWTQSNELEISDKFRLKVFQWLSPPDPSSNHNNARKICHPTTGTWFTTGNDFANWKKEESSSLWLCGNPGCGKTILCSTIIEDALRERKTGSVVAIGYFYFDFSDYKKRTFDGLVRSLTAQLAGHYASTPAELRTLHAEHLNGELQPSTDALVRVLRSLVRELPLSYFLIDAMDECMERESLLGWIECLMSEGAANLRLLVTSRSEKDIGDCLTPSVSRKINIQGAVAEADILTHINERLENDSKLKKWPSDLQAEIRTRLRDDAQGMFRWVACQLDSLRKCIRVSELREALNCLPKSLDETYERILLDINVEYRDDAVKILRWLAFSARPVTLAEVAEALAVNGSCFYPEQRLPDPEDLLAICPNLVCVTDPKFPSYDLEWFDTDLKEYLNPNNVTAGELRLAHYSVKEYLVSDRAHRGAACAFSLNKKMADTFISHSCLAYLLHFDTYRYGSRYHEFPLARYAAEYWVFHAKSDDDLISDTLNQMITILLRPNSNQFFNWIRLCKLEFPGEQAGRGRRYRKTHPLYYMSLHGLAQVLRSSLDGGADVNAKGGVYGNALQAAICGCHETVTCMLIESGAEVNAVGGYYGSALQAASRRGYEGGVRLLLDAGANVNAQGGEYGNALQAASLEGRVEVVSALLDAGANINAQGGMFGNALQAASYRGRDVVVTLLLATGANVNEAGGKYGNALQAAMAGGEGCKGVVPLLLGAGADVNAQSGYYGTALQAACYRGFEAGVHLLLDAGAQVNVTGGEFGSAIQAASRVGCEPVVQLLLAAGADPNLFGQADMSALQAASYYGHERLVQMLLGAGAQVNDRGRKLGDALLAASNGGHVDIARLLLDSGADPNSHMGWYGVTVHSSTAAGSDDEESIPRLSPRRHEAKSRKKLDTFAEVHQQGGWSQLGVEDAANSCRAPYIQRPRKHTEGHTLSAASRRGDVALTRLLLDRGVNVKARGPRESALMAALNGRIQVASSAAVVVSAQLQLQRVATLQAYETIVMLLLKRSGYPEKDYAWTLHAASMQGDEAMVRVLLEAGEQVDIQLGDTGVLQVASAKGHASIVRLLLDAQVDLNQARGEHREEALQAAVTGGHAAVIQLLLDAGVDVNAQGKWYGHGLQAASYRGDETIVRLLLDAGADANAQREEYGTSLQVASYRGKDTIVRLLLDAGADVNAQQEGCGTLLQVTSHQGEETRGHHPPDVAGSFDPEVQAQDYGSPLQNTSYPGGGIPPYLLLNATTVMYFYAQMGKYGNALQAAGYGGSDVVLQLLLDAGANVNAQGGEYGGALQAASFRGHETAMQLLLDKGADVNAMGGEYGSALQAAALSDKIRILQLLMDVGANVNLVGGKHGTAIQAACYKGREDVVWLLLEAGADVNVVGGEYGTALQAASYRGHEKLVRWLLDRGADVNAQGGKYGNALKASEMGLKDKREAHRYRASFDEYEAIRKMLTEAGALEVEE